MSPERFALQMPSYANYDENMLTESCFLCAPYNGGASTCILTRHFFTHS